MRRIHISVRSQVAAFAALGLVVLAGVAGITSTVVNAPGVARSITEYASRTGEVAAMEDRVAAMQAEVAAIRKDATARADMLSKRQEFLATLLEGKKADPKAMAAMIAPEQQPTTNASKPILATYNPVYANQLILAEQVHKYAEARIAEGTSTLKQLGIDPDRIPAQGGMGGPLELVGPYEDVSKANVQPVTVAALPGAAPAQPQPVVQADPQFRALFNSWKRLDNVEQTIGGIPSAKPIQTQAMINSGFGVRSDPFVGRAAMHAGVDMPGPIGTPIFATADGIVGRAGRVGGYGNLIEMDHGRGIVTRYGHLSAILVAPGAKVKRGDKIGLMGSTGRSTGSHLHYEVRIDGKAVNPNPFLRSSDYLVALQNRANAQTAAAMGGPAKAE